MHALLCTATVSLLLMYRLLPRCRPPSLAQLVAAHRPTPVPLEFAAQQIGFADVSQVRVEGGGRWVGLLGGWVGDFTTTSKPRKWVRPSTRVLRARVTRAHDGWVQTQTRGGSLHGMSTDGCRCRHGAAPCAECQQMGADADTGRLLARSVDGWVQMQTRGGSLSGVSTDGCRCRHGAAPCAECRQARTHFS